MKKMISVPSRYLFGTSWCCT